VENCLSGFNSSVFAYGQTGSGKTHTMIGELPEETDLLPPNVRKHSIVQPFASCQASARLQAAQMVLH
jgi:hypothetical protein